MPSCIWKVIHLMDGFDYKKTNFCVKKKDRFRMGSGCEKTGARDKDQNSFEFIVCSFKFKIKSFFCALCAFCGRNSVFRFSQRLCVSAVKVCLIL